MIFIDEKNLITIADAARMRGVSVQAVCDLVKRGRLKTVQIMGKSFIPLSELEEFEKQSVGRKRKQKEQASAA